METNGVNFLQQIGEWTCKDKHKHINLDFTVTLNLEKEESYTTRLAER